jgi:hypothetical protein
MEREACSFHPNGCPELAHTPDAAEAIEQLLIKGAHLVQDSIAHVTHGGPTIEQARAWIKEVEKYVSLSTVRVIVG